MRCQRARVLMGVHDELDSPTRRALAGHVRDCRACADSWLAESEYRRLMAGYGGGVSFSDDLQGRLLAIPGRDLRGARLRARLTRWRVPLGVTVVAAAVVLWLIGGGLGSLPFDLDRAAPQTPIAARESAAPVPVAVVPTAITRQGVVALVAAEDDGPPVEQVGPVATATARVVAAVPDVSAPPLATALVPAAAAAAGDGGPTVASSGGRSDPPAGGARLPSPTAQPTALPPTAVPPTSTAVPATATPLPTAADVTLVVAARSERGTVRDVLFQVDALREGARTPLFEGWVAPGADGVARRVLRSELQRVPAERYEVTFLVARGLALCPDEQAVRPVDAAALRAGPVTVEFALCPTDEPTPAAEQPPQPDEPLEGESGAAGGESNEPARSRR